MEVDAGIDVMDGEEDIVAVTDGLDDVPIDASVPLEVAAA